MIPHGLTTMLEGLSRAVLKKRPDNLKYFALYYLTELKKFKNENPSFGIKKLVVDFHKHMAERLRDDGFEEDLKMIGLEGIRPGLSRLTREEAALPSRSIPDRVNRIPSTAKGDPVLATHITESNLQVNGRQDNYARPKSSLVVKRHGISPVTIDWKLKSSSVKQQSVNARGKEVEVKQGGAPNKSANSRSSGVSENGMVGDAPVQADSNPCTESKVTLITPNHKETLDTPCKHVNEIKELVHDLSKAQEQRERILVTEGLPSPRGDASTIPQSRCPEGHRAAATTTGTKRESLGVKTQDIPTTNRRRVRIDALAQVPEESFTRSSAAKPSGRKNERRPLNAEEVVHSEQGYQDTEHQRYEVSPETNHDYSHDDEVWRGRHISKDESHGKVFLPIQCHAACCCAQRRYHQECTFHYPTSQDYSYHQGFPTHHPGLLHHPYAYNYSPVCQPQINPCHCAAESTVPLAIHVPRCVMVRLHTTGRLKQQTQIKPCRTSTATNCWNEGHAVTRRRCVPPTLMSSRNYPTDSDSYGLPYQPKSAMKYVPGYVPMDDHSVQKDLRHVHSAAYVPFSYVMEADEGRRAHRRPSAPSKRVALSKPYGDLH